MHVDDLWTTLETPLGPLTLHGGRGGLTTLSFAGRGPVRAERRRAPAAFAQAAAQLEGYFALERRAFDVELDLGGTPFQRAVWEAVRAIPYGTTVSYSELAARTGRPDRVRAVAAAVGRTPVPIVVPCHRVVAADGGLTGYVGGLARKRALLDLELRGSAGDAPVIGWAGRQLVLA